MKEHRKLRYIARIVTMIVLIAGAAVAGLLGLFDLITERLALSIALGLLAALALSDIIQSNDLRAILKQLSSSSRFTENTSKILRELTKEKMELHAELLDPLNFEEYKSAWRGFTGTYFAFNPVYAPEEFLDTKGLVDDVYLPRFSDPEFEKAFYLFYIDQNQGGKNLEIFHSILSRIQKEIGRELDSKIEIRLLRESSPSYEYYLGKKGSSDVAVIDFRMPVILKLHGLPDYVFMVYNRNVIEKLRGDFLHRWEKGQIISLTKFMSKEWGFQSL